MNSSYHKRNRWLQALMLSSIILLLALQYIWLRSEYRSAEESFRRETNLVFRSTVTSLLDSLYMSRIELQPGDTVISRKTFMNQKGHHEVPVAALGRALKLDFSNSKLLLLEDSADSLLLPGQGRKVTSFMIRINPDSLETGRIGELFGARLLEHDRRIGFRVLEKIDKKVKTPDDTAYVTDFIRIDPSGVRQYAASFEGVPLLIFQEMYPQVAFSLLLTAMIAMAFFTMYRSLRKQQRLSQQKDDFISNVSHELKTPVATVSVALEAFRNFSALNNPQLTQEYLDIVKTELDRLSAMTEQILNTTAYEHNFTQVKNEDIDFNILVNQVVMICKSMVGSTGAVIEYTASGSDFTLKGSQVHLTNMLHNLVDNAIKYSQAPARITVTLRAENDHLVLRVQDQGIGIPQEYRQKVFEKFFRVPQGDVHNVKGYGLGLAYVAQVIKAHGGSITADSAPQGGTIFTIKLARNG